MSQLIDDTVTELIGSTPTPTYVPHEWDCDELITAEALNRMEQGIANAGGGALVIKVVEETNTKDITDTTWTQAYEAMMSGRVVLTIARRSVDGEFSYEPYYSGGMFTTSGIDDPRHSAVFVSPTHATNPDEFGIFYADTADGYLYAPVESIT